jgi:acetyltransferase-like isoleucine patch superfamily enzyme
LAYYSRETLETMGFKYLGDNVKISDKASIYNCNQISIGDNSRIDDFCVVSGNITIGRNVHFAPFCLVAGGEPGIIFEDFSGLAYHAQVFSQSDDYSGHALTNPTVPARYTHASKKAVHIGKHVIVGAGSIIMPGVTLNEGTAVGAMSLVRKSTEAWTIYLGNPAKKITIRSKKLLNLEEEYLQSEKKNS